MAAILAFFCFHTNWPLWPPLRLNILLNFALESESIRANLHGNKRIQKWRPFWNKVYVELQDLMHLPKILVFVPVYSISVKRPNYQQTEMGEWLSE